MSLYTDQKYPSYYCGNGKSHNIWVSQKMLYRMDAQFYKRHRDQLDLNQYQRKEDRQLQNLKRKNNPFSKTHLFNQSLVVKKTNNSEIGYHWTDEKNRNNYKQPSMYRSQANILKQYQKIRIKQTQPCVYHQKQIKSNSDNVQQRFRFQTTLGKNSQHKFLSFTNSRRSPQQVHIKQLNNIQPRNIQYQTQIFKPKQPFKIWVQANQKQVNKKSYQFLPQTNTSPQQQSPKRKQPKQLMGTFGDINNKNFIKFQKNISFSSNQYYLAKLGMQEN